MLHITFSGVINVIDAGSVNEPGDPPAPESSCALSGTITSATQNTIVSGGATIVLTLTADSWVATVGEDNAITTALIDGLDSAQSETNGWNNIVRDNLTYTAVERTSDTVVTITLPAFAGYATLANETITATVPGSALLYTTEGLTASPTATITTIEETVSVTGTLITEGATEAEIVSGGKTMIFTVSGDQWVSALGSDDPITTAFLAGITSAQTEETGWNNEVRDNLAFGNLTRNSSTQCTLLLPASASYDITTTETITATIPASALLVSTGSIVASPTATVGAEAGAGLLMHSDWSTATGNSDAAMRDTDKSTPWDSDVPTTAEVISASGLFSAGFTNCMRMYGNLTDYGFWGIGLGGFANVVYNPGTPSAGNHLYERFYFRHDMTDCPTNYTAWAGTHPVEFGTPQGAVLFKPSVQSGSTWILRIQMFASNSPSPISTYTLTGLSKETEYRIETHLEFNTVNGGGTSGNFYLDFRLYNAAGSLVADASDFDTDFSSSLHYWNHAWSSPRQIQNRKLGQNSSYNLSWASGPAREIEMWKYGGYCLRSDTWPGPYAGGV